MKIQILTAPKSKKGFGGKLMPFTPPGFDLGNIQNQVHAETLYEVARKRHAAGPDREIVGWVEVPEAEKDEPDAA